MGDSTPPPHPHQKNNFPISFYFFFFNGKNRAIYLRCLLFYDKVSGCLTVSKSNNSGTEQSPNFREVFLKSRKRSLIEWGYRNKIDTHKNTKTGKGESEKGKKTAISLTY